MADAIRTEKQFNQSNEKQHWLRFAAPFAAAGALVVGALAYTHGRSDIIQPTPSAETVTPEVNLPPLTVAGIKMESLSDNEVAISAKRPNGRDIRLPKLRYSEPNRMGALVLDYISGYLTTGDLKILNAMTDSPEVKRILINNHDTVMKERLSSIGPKSDELVGLFYEDRDMPVTFSTVELSKANRKEVISVADGDLYFQTFYDHTSDKTDMFDSQAYQVGADRGQYTYRANPFEVTISANPGDEATFKLDSLTWTTDDRR